MSGSEPDDPFARVGRELGGNDARRAAPSIDLGEIVSPAAAGAPAPLRRHRKFGLPSRVWRYTSATGELLQLVARFDQADGGKVVLPLTLWRNKRGLSWHWKASPDLRPLYGLQDLAERPIAPVLIVEGEKTADAARDRFADVVVITWPGGCKAASKVDWRPLIGRRVTIWPDADQPGSEAAADVGRRLEANGVRCAVVALPESLPEGWDLGDPWLPNFGLNEARAALEGAETPSSVVTWPYGYRSDANGVWWDPGTNGKGEAVPPVFLCSRLDIVAEARDEDGGDWSTVVEFCDRDGRRKQDVVGQSELAGEGLEVRRRLLGLGLRMNSSKTARERLSAGLSAVMSTQRARLATSTGWKGSRYVLPHKVIGGDADEKVIYRGRGASAHYGSAGSYASWRSEVAEAARGNDFLMFALSCAFAAPLMRPLGIEGGGFHIRGNSSCGKTTILRVAGSVWGGGGELGFAQSWRNTDNAMEGVALAHNDCLLCLDELRQLAAAAAPQVAYALSNGVGKGRMKDTAEMKARHSWRVLFLSAGEIGLAELIQLDRSGDRAYAGQELRLIDLEADFEDGLGAWQNTYGATSPAAFAEALKGSTSRHYGYAGSMFVERFTAKRADAVAQAERIQAAFLGEVARQGDTGQVHRAAQRFAMAAAAGELAAAYDVVPWRPGEASASAQRLFERWAARFGRKVVREDTEALRKVRAFLERYGHSRFIQLNHQLSEGEASEDEMYDDATGSRSGEARSLDIAGYVGNLPSVGKVYHFNPEFWRGQIFVGSDGSRAAKAIKEAGFLVTGPEKNRLVYKIKTAGQALNVYSVKASILANEGGDD